MEIKLLCEGYKNKEELFVKFSENRLWESQIVSEETVYVPSVPDFPIYFEKMKKKENKMGFWELLHVIEKNFLSIERDIYMDERFWHSYLCLYKRNFLSEIYPLILQDINEFKKIVLKSFNWENYIYKAVLAAQYVTDHVMTDDQIEKDRYYRLILQNMDVFNYIIKYGIFRNGNFLINILDIIDETGLSSILKAKIKDRPDLGKDTRYGRMVIFEFNKSYPIILAPMLERDQLKEYFLKYLSYYYKDEEFGME